MSKNRQKLDIFFQKTCQKFSIFSKKIAIGNFFEKNENFGQFFFEKMSNFWRFFDIQMAIFRRVRHGASIQRFKTGFVTGNTDVRGRKVIDY